MTDLLDEVCAWVRGGSYVPDGQEITDLVFGEEARLLAEAFTGDDGRSRLMIFARLTVLRPPVNHSLPSGEGQAYAQLRQGQDSIFAALVRYLDLHEANTRSPDHDRPDRPAFTLDAASARWTGGEPADAPEPAGAGSWDAAGLIAGG